MSRYQQQNYKPTKLLSPRFPGRVIYLFLMGIALIVMAVVMLAPIYQLLKTTSLTKFPGTIEMIINGPTIILLFTTITGWFKQDKVKKE